MKKTLSRIISLLLAAVTIVSAMPVLASAPDAPVLNYKIDEYGSAMLEWNEISYYSTYNVYMSTDGINFSICEEDICSEQYYIYNQSGKGMTYYYVTAVSTTYHYDLDCDEYVTTEESQPSNIVAVPQCSCETVNAYGDSYDGEIRIGWSCGYASEPADKNYDGFIVYFAVGSNELSPIATVPANSYNSKSEYRYSYSYVVTNNASAGTYRYLVATYTVIDGVTYTRPDFEETETLTVYMNSPELTVKTKSVKLKWDKATGVDCYEIWQSKNDKAFKKIATVGSDVSKYTVKNIDTYKNSYRYYIVCISGGVKSCQSYYASCDNPELRFSTVKKLKKKKTTVDVVNTRTKKTTKAWTVSLTSADRKTLDKWTKKNFKKGWTDYQKITYALNWINTKVTYAKGGSYNKIASKTYVDAIFNKKLGQCLQYNGAAAMLLTYMGYDVRIVQGWRGYSMSNKWSHYWCEIKIDGKWYLVETGNHQDGLSPCFAVPYRQTGGYMLNQKVAK